MAAVYVKKEFASLTNITTLYVEIYWILQDRGRLLLLPALTDQFQVCFFIIIIFIVNVFKEGISFVSIKKLLSEVKLLASGWILRCSLWMGFSVTTEVKIYPKTRA